MKAFSALLCLAIALPAFAAAGKGKNDWDRVAQIAGVQPVQVHLRDGRTLKGNVLEFRADGVTFISERQLRKIDLRRVVGASVSEAGQVREIEGQPHLRKGQTVQLKFRDGGVASGLVQEVDQAAEQLQLAENSAGEHIARGDILRVTRVTRWKSALVGAGAGLVLGALVARGKSDLGHGMEFVVAGSVFGGIGTGLGAAIGSRTLIYEAPPL